MEIDTLTGKQNTMGIIDTTKKIERQEGIEQGKEKYFLVRTYNDSPPTAEHTRE